MTRIHTPSSDARPAIDASEVGWAAGELAEMLRRVPGDSVVSKVLTRTLRELDSLKQSTAGEVVGPFRMRAAA